MRITTVFLALLVAALVIRPGISGGQTSIGPGANAPAQTVEGKAKHAKAVKAPPVQSGIYGFSGARAPDPTAAPSGVVGECIWIFDADNKNQVAKGDCAKKDPGNFRVVLKPGHYVVHGPGGNETVEVKPGGWVKVTSIALIPVSF